MFLNMKRLSSLASNSVMLAVRSNNLIRNYLRLSSNLLRIRAFLSIKTSFRDLRLMFSAKTLKFVINSFTFGISSSNLSGKARFFCIHSELVSQTLFILSLLSCYLLFARAAKEIYLEDWNL